jgi:hypothetical protein
MIPRQRRPSSLFYSPRPLKFLYKGVPQRQALRLDYVGLQLELVHEPEEAEQNKQVCWWGS